MAFNPFNVFRKNQKILFALLTVMVMFMFVLSSGMGQSDFFQWFPQWLGSQRGAGGETVATVNGRRLTTGQLSQTSQSRLRANEFMAALSGRASERLAKTLDDATAKADRESGQLFVRNLLQSRQNNYLSQQDQTQFMMAQFQGQPLPPNAVTMARLREIDRQLQMIDFMASSQSTKAEDKELARTGKLLVNLDATRMFSPTYFGSVGVATTRDAFEFELWRKKADALGITVTPADAEKMAYAELGDRVNEADFKEIVRDIQARDGRFTSDALRQTLADEFRVRLAQVAVLGSSGRGDADVAMANQTISAPYQVYQYYKQETDESAYGVLAVPAENFLAQVKGEPTEPELRELFTKYRVMEPNPVLERPGFKEPRKLKVEWLEAKGDEVFFKTAAKDALPKGELFAKLSGLLVAPVDPVAATSVIAGAALLSIKPEAVYESVYDSYTLGAKANIQSLWDVQFFRTQSDVTDASYAKPGNLAALAAVTAGSLMGFGPPATGPLVMLDRARTEERNALARAQAALFTIPLPGAVAPLAPVGTVAARTPAPLPMAVLKPEAEKKVLDRLARLLCFNDLEKFQTELAKLGKGVDKAGAKDYLDQFAKARGFNRGMSQEFKDAFAMYEDKGLAPLFERFKKVAGEKTNPIGFGNLFFNEQDFRGQSRPASSQYVPESYPPQTLNRSAFVGDQLADAPPESALLVWRVGEEAAVDPKSIDDPKVRAKVVAAWKRIKARELAKAKADELAKQAGTFGTNPDVIRSKLIDAQASLKATAGDAAAMDRVKYFEIKPVAPLVGGMALMPGRQPWTEFRYLPNENAPYATAEMTTELLKNRDKPIGTAVVVPDNPKDVYYVAVLSERVERSSFEFSRGIYAPIASQRDDMGSVIKNRFQSDAQQKAREMAVNLLKAEFKVENENEKALAEKGDS
jgi:hypothetical protein